MKKIFFLVTALLGLKGNAIDSDLNQPTCEDRLTREKSYNLRLKEVIFKSNSSAHVLTPSEVHFVNGLMENAKIEEMINSSECEITD